MVRPSPVVVRGAGVSRWDFLDVPIYSNPRRPTPSDVFSNGDDEYTALEATDLKSGHMVECCPTPVTESSPWIGPP